MFVGEMAGTCARVAKSQNRKTLQVQDIMNVAGCVDKFHFIYDSKLPALDPSN